MHHAMPRASLETGFRCIKSICWQSPAPFEEAGIAIARAESGRRTIERQALVLSPAPCSTACTTGSASRPEKSRAIAMRARQRAIQGVEGARQRCTQRPSSPLVRQALRHGTGPGTTRAREHMLQRRQHLNQGGSGGRRAGCQTCAQKRWRERVGEAIQ